MLTLKAFSVQNVPLFLKNYAIVISKICHIIPSKTFSLYRELKGKIHIFKNMKAFIFGVRTWKGLIILAKNIFRHFIETPQHRDLKPLVRPGVASGQACDVAGQASPQARRATLQGRHRLRPSINPVASPKATGKSRLGVTSGQACDVAGQASLQARHARRQASFLWPGNSPVAKNEPSVKWPTVRVSPALGVRLFIYLSIMAVTARVFKLQGWDS